MPLTYHFGQFFNNTKKASKNDGSLWVCKFKMIFVFLLQRKNSEEMDLTVERATSVILDRRHLLVWNLNTGFIVQILDKVLGAEPSYANFYKTFMHPLTSKLMRRLSTDRTTKERLAGFTPLKKFVAKGLEEQRDELVELGMYEDDDPENFLSDPDGIADRMMRALVVNDFDLVSVSKWSRPHPTPGFFFAVLACH